MDQYVNQKLLNLILFRLKGYNGKFQSFRTKRIKIDNYGWDPHGIRRSLQGDLSLFGNFTNKVK